MKRRALISVSDKTNIDTFSKHLVDLGFEIISTGGTSKYLKSLGIKVMDISEITNFPEILDGRVKTLHPSIHGGLLYRRDKENHITEVKNNRIDAIDLVVVNLYPFENTVSKKSHTLEEAIENIDIGGPSMLRSAAKNYKDVYVVFDTNDYDKVIDDIKNKTNSIELKEYLATKVFNYTSYYDGKIGNYLKNKLNITEVGYSSIPTKKIQELRYGENPHQKATVYKVNDENYSLLNAKQLNGKELSFNNYNDANSALNILKEFYEPTVVSLKHNNPCGVGSAENIYDAWKKAYEGDPVSIFGGIVALNRTVTNEIALELNKLFLEIVIAPSYEKSALEVLTAKKNLRVLELETLINNELAPKVNSINGGILIQDFDNTLWDEEFSNMKCVTNTKASLEEIEDLKFAWKIVKHVKSNAIVIVKNKMVIGVGAGQMNRLESTKIALNKHRNLLIGSVLASDAFFPMKDSLEQIRGTGVSAIIQPGGSIKDAEVINEANSMNVSMYLTGIRHFSH